jgi:hypothetical protein
MMSDTGHINPHLSYAAQNTGHVNPHSASNMQESDNILRDAVKKYTK